LADFSVSSLAFGIFYKYFLAGFNLALINSGYSPAEVKEVAEYISQALNYQQKSQFTQYPKQAQQPSAPQAPSSAMNQAPRQMQRAPMRTMPQQYKSQNTMTAQRTQQAPMHPVQQPDYIPRPLPQLQQRKE